ncbi:unnamed protein product [Lactuca saligna]|uniref:Uncharacterized protein n=1 Tax=Lactuca saligna TaxID=75948 RepID=A0AA36A2B9_LACSI|nr:unnamed protein product [Lactuca saligna]
MLRRVDPTNVVLVAYLKNIDPTVQTGILLPREEKTFKRSKKNEPGSSEKLVSETTSKKSPKKKPSEVKVVKEVFVDVSIPIEPVVDDTQEKVGVVFREILAPVSPLSKKCMAEDMAKQISKREKKKIQKIVITTTSTEDEDE